ncbi:anthranilate synthase component I family protein [Streptomyces sp. TRM72054]|uniref:anthranilate synthase component I family protein n=1 Tax=Streptomyces sp. TRM72054 TaxID=2870562 RepID=UPI001C8B487D|nr:anthranilate synthase component I family protein [Streptomyces sp. TRM72054]MBX9399485.1 anthranilate synthase component I family protein [Streptomyces sp. TRM72054]
MTETTSIISTLGDGDTVHRCEMLLPGPIDPVRAAAAMRGNGRILLGTSDASGRQPGTLAVGELALISRGLSSEQNQCPQEGALDEAVRFLESLQFAPAAMPEERRWFGVISYDAVRDIERLKPRADQGLPVYDFFIPEVIIRFEPGAVRVIGRGDSRRSAVRACARVGRLLVEANPCRLQTPRAGRARFTLKRSDYDEALQQAKRHIVDGDIFQVVLSLGLIAESEADGLAIYEALVSVNPSPYQFWYRSRQFEVVGCSPEPCVTLGGGRAKIRPLAGTRPRGADAAADQLAERELRNSEKELAEHRMLVDLARNDLGRVCTPGTISVPELMEVERYSHVMHLMSHVTGELHSGRTAAELISATFPAGTMTGAPKVRAMEIIDELEPVDRALYSGAVGSFGLDDVDLYLTIRSIVVHQGRVRLQAGGGIVHDSDAATEHAECLAKLGAAARAIGIDMDRAAR